MIANVIGNTYFDGPRMLLCKWTCDDPTRIYKDYIESRGFYRELSEQEIKDHYPNPSAFPECELYSTLAYRSDDDMICFSGSLPHFLKDPPKDERDWKNSGIYEHQGIEINRAWESFMDQIKILQGTRHAKWLYFRRVKNKSFNGKELMIYRNRP